MGRAKGSANFPSIIKQKPQDTTIKEIELMASIGYSKAWIADELGVSENQLEMWMVRYDELRGAWRRGQSYRRKRALRCAFETAFPLHECTEKCPDNCKRKGKPEKGDTQMAIFLLKSQFGLSEKSQIEVAGNIVVQSQIGNDGTLNREIISVQDVRTCIEAEIINKESPDVSEG